MIWFLLFAHFLADYPLQPDWMVLNKTRPWVLLLHILIHWGVMLGLFWAYFPIIWPYITILAAIHLCIDIGKNWFNVHYPEWTIRAYLVDQLCHIISIYLIAEWILQNKVMPPDLPLDGSLALVGLGLLWVSYVWLITERIIVRGRLDDWVSTDPQQEWSRLFFRSGFYMVLLLASNVIAPASASILQFPYPDTLRGKTALVIDIALVIAVVGFVSIANRF
ncbi:MAG: DUF3307 domain-containing protein [Anaerolineaceae bacterium]|nr:DUF3307 domain-containing protein [Anaerolineaceae bacterium]